MRGKFLYPLADLGGREGRTPPPGRPNSFDFMQFSGKFGVFTPPLEGSRPPLGKILDPPLLPYPKSEKTVSTPPQLCSKRDGMVDLFRVLSAAKKVLLATQFT